MKFAEFHKDQIIEVGSHVVTAAEIVEFSRRYDPQPFHVDEAAARASRWNGLIASGFHTCGIAMRMVVDHLLKGSESAGSPGMEYVKWQKPVRAGDTLRLRVRVLEAKPSASGNTGILRWQWLLLNQRDETVLDLVVTSLFDLRSKERALSGF